jgi:hypothetical protein
MINILFGNKQDPSGSRRMSSYMSAMKDMHNSKPFLSEAAFGSYVGLCLCEAELEDDIFISVGSHIPYVFRKAGDGCFKIISEAYVQGFMYGEVLELNLHCQEVRLI